MLRKSFMEFPLQLINRNKKTKDMLEVQEDRLNLKELVALKEKVFEGKKYLYLPKDGADSLIVSMSTHNYGERYYCLRHLIELCPCGLLFLKDPNNTYYLDKDGGESVARLLKTILKNYSPGRVSFFGSSMYGYAALRNSILFNCNAIVCNPQICFRESYQSAWKELRETLKRANYNNQFQDIPELCKNKKLESLWFITYGDSPIDQLNVLQLKNMKDEESRILYSHFPDLNHGFYFGNISTVIDLHFLLIQLRALKLVRI